MSALLYKSGTLLVVTASKVRESYTGVWWAPLEDRSDAQKMSPGDVFLCLDKGTRVVHSFYVAHHWMALLNEKVVVIWANSDTNGTFNLRKVRASKTRKDSAHAY